MAHEALKFNVLTENKTNWQPILGSQDFGTFYMIYIRFTKLLYNSDKYHYYAEFKLQNYNGPITMGFESTPILYELKEEDKRIRNEQLKTLIPKFEEMSEEEKQKNLEEHRVDFRLDINVKPFDLDLELKESKLTGVSKVLQGGVLETNVTTVSPDGDLYNPKDLDKSKYINPKHYERSGDEYMLIGRKNKDSIEPFDYYGGIGTLLTKCNPSRSYLL